MMTSFLHYLAPGIGKSLPNSFLNDTTQILLLWLILYQLFVHPYVWITGTTTNLPVSP